MWDESSCRRLHSLNRASAVALSPDGETMAVSVKNHVSLVITETWNESHSSTFANGQNSERRLQPRWAIVGDWQQCC